MKDRLMFCVLTACLLVSLLSVSSLAADVRPNGFTITPFAGWYLFEGNSDYDDGPIFGLGLGYRFSEHWSTELSLSYADLTKDLCEDDSCDEDFFIGGYGAYLDLVYDFFPQSVLVPFVSVGMGAMALDYDEDDYEEPPVQNKNMSVFRYGAGIRYGMTDRFDLRLDVRHVLGFDIADDADQDYDLHNNMEATLGLTYAFGGSRPAAPMTSDDQDQDGVPDAIDQCPNTASNIDVNARGCPPDDDQDGVYDYQDQCPGSMPGAQVDIFGCSKDTDNDGVIDSKDKCPGTPPNAGVDVNGCTLDSDKDGVRDLMDKCPNTPTGLAVDETGCQTVAEKKIRLNLKIEFESGKSDISTASLDQVKEVAEVMKQYPNSTAVIEAHTDSSGGSDYNLELSQKRADMVVHYLTSFFGINRARLRASGYGESRPIADNRTKAGRKRNRRAVAIITATQSEK